MSRQVNTTKKKQVRIDVGVHHYSKVKAVKQGKTLRQVMDTLLCDWLGGDGPAELKHKVKKYLSD